VEGVIHKFLQIADSQSLLVANSSDYVRNVLKLALGDDKATLLVDRILQGSDVSGIESLKWMDALSVAELLRNEHPQIVAAIVVHLEPDQTAEVRKASLGGVKTAAEIVNLMGTAIEGTVLESIRSVDADLAQKIMDKMFVFDDVILLDGKSIQRLLRDVTSDMLIVALKGAQPELKEKILNNMSVRAAASMREDLESRGPMRLSEVETQQKEILKIVRRLADEGEIVISAGGGEDAMV
jgi:flagellar motor switch protein FliG